MCTCTSPSTLCVSFQVIAPEEIIDPSVDEQSVMTYLSQFPKAKLKPGAPLKPKLNPKKARAYGPGESLTNIPHLPCSCLHRNTQRYLRNTHVLATRQIQVIVIPKFQVIVILMNLVRFDGIDSRSKCSVDFLRYLLHHSIISVA